MRQEIRGTEPTITKRAALSASKGIRIVLVTLLGSAVAINIVDAVGRTFFSAPIFWTEEVLSMMLVLMVLCGLLETSARGRDIRIDLFAHTKSVPEHLLSALRRLALLVSTLICLVVAAAAYQVVEIMWQTGRRSVVVGLEMVWIHGPVLACLVAVAGIYLYRALRSGGS